MNQKNQQSRKSRSDGWYLNGYKYEPDDHRQRVIPMARGSPFLIVIHRGEQPSEKESRDMKRRGEPASRTNGEENNNKDEETEQRPGLDTT